MKTTFKSNIEWKKWGEADPLMGVATRAGKSADGTNPWQDEEFYDLGRSDWSDFVERWRRYGYNNASCLEIGCGVGRITQQLASNFQHVYALDVSEGMIAFAKKHVQPETVTFLLGDGLRVPLPDESVTSVFSTHVFQHFDSIEHASGYFAEVARVLKPEGSLMIHLPIHHWPAMAGVFNAFYKARKQLGDIRARARRQLIRFRMSGGFMRGLSYSQAYLFEFLPSCGLTDVEITAFPTKAEGTIHSFVFARRTACK